jgi:hypothetical protein
MFERLFELFLHAKTGLIAGVFLIGTTGALVTATVQNGVTTITITEASPSPSGSASPSASASATATASASASASASATASPTGSPTASPTGSPSSSPSSSPSACNSQAKAAADAVKTVDRAFSQFHTDLEHLRKDNKGDAAQKVIEDADKQLKQIRQNAVTAIHATSTCPKGKDDDEDENDQNDNDKEDGQKSTGRAEGNFLVVFFNKLFGQNPTVTVVTTSASPSPSPTPTATTSPVPTPTPTATTGTSNDPKTIADNAVAAMKLVFDTAKSSLPAATATASRSPRASRSPDLKNKDGHDGKGDD